MASGDRSGDPKDVKPLFPVVLSKQTDASSQSLFPVNPDISTNLTSTNNGDSDLDWLENKSFIPTSILLAQEEREEKRSAASHSPRTPSSPTILVKSELSDAAQPSSEEEQHNAYHAEIKPEKRSRSESESGEDSLSAQKTSKRHDHSTSREKKKHKKRKKKKHKHKESRSKGPAEGSKDSRLDKPSEFWENQTTKTFLQEIPGLTPEFAFRLDRKAEKSLWNYESVYKGHIAQYRLLTNRCLGNTDVQLGEKKTKDKDASCRYYSKDNRREARRKGILVTVDKHVEKQTAEYISVQDKDRGNEGSSHSNPLGVLDSATSLYVQGKGLTPGDRNEDESPVDETLERTAFYNRRLQEDPSNVKLWVEFVSFQDQVFQDARFSAESMANRRMKDVFQPPRACMEKKLAILGKALKANPSSLDLKLLKLEIEQDVSDSSALAKEWDDLLFVHAGDVRLWRHYLTFQQSRLATFTVSRLVKLYHRCFRTLGPILENKVKVVTRTETLEEDLIGVFEQYCRFLHQSGFTEKAVASYQALIEFNLFRPPSLNLTPTQDSAAVFESFWDSGVARFGERGAKGWASWVDASKSGASPALPGGHGSTEEEQEQILQQDLPVWQTWLKIERLRQGIHWLPWRPDTTKGETEEDCEDLDRLVLYDDVAPVLLRLTQSCSFCRLIHSFVDLLGLVQRQRLDDAVLAFDQLNLAALHQVPSASGIGASIQVDSSWQPHAEVVCFLEEVLRQSAAYFSGYQQTLFNCQLLRLQAEKQGVCDLLLLSDKATKEVRKFGKSLLKEVQNRNDLLLWDAYIRSEWAFGKVKDALSMLQTALGMFSSSASGDDPTEMAGLCSLYRTLAEICLNFTPLELVSLTTRKPSPSLECKNKVLSSYACLVERTRFVVPKGESVPAAQVLRTRRKFQSVVTDLLSDSTRLSEKSSAPQHFIMLVNCFALFELCAAGVVDAVQIFDTALQLCASPSQKDTPSQTTAIHLAMEKDLHQSLLHLLKNYMAVNPLSMTVFRSHLDCALSRFPNSPWFLCQFVDMELKTFLAGRLRRYFETAGQDPASVFPVLFGVLAELGRHARLLAASTSHSQGQGEGLSDSGIVHRVRAACERGLQCKVAQHCPLLWRVYLAFEAGYGNMGRAKGVLYRALQACPWAKVLYTDGAELFGEDQLQELVDLMTEKELRVQIPLEEVELLMSSEPQGPEDKGEDSDEASNSP